MSDRKFPLLLGLAVAALFLVAGTSALSSAVQLQRERAGSAPAAAPHSRLAPPQVATLAPGAK
jgi:hypothetical protein